MSKFDLTNRLIDVINKYTRRQGMDDETMVRTMAGLIVAIRKCQPQVFLKVSAVLAQYDLLSDSGPAYSGTRARSPRPRRRAV